MCSVQEPIRPSSIACNNNNLEIEETVSSIRAHRVLPDNAFLFTFRSTWSVLGTSGGARDNNTQPLPRKRVFAALRKTCKK